MGDYMTQQCSIELVDNHVIVLLGGQRVLLDTGSPMSFGNLPTLRLLGQDYPLQPRHPNTTIAQLAEQVGAPLDALLGQDILGALYYVIDWHGQTVRFSPSPLPFEGQRFPVEKIAGIPLLNISLSGQSLRVFVDTGAKLSYLAPNLVAGQSSTAEASDFYPGFGAFMTPLYQMPVHIGGLSLNVAFGGLPPRLHASLLGDRAEGILGSDLLRAFQVYFALPESRIGLMPN